MTGALAAPVLHHEARGRAGSGAAPVLFLHGLGSSSVDWAFQVPAFEALHPVLLADLPGHGRSAVSPRLSIDRMAADVERLLARVGAPPAHVVGLSLGGCVGLALALRRPAAVRSLTVVNAFPRLRPAGPRAALAMATRLALLATAPMPRVAAHVARGLFPRPEQASLYAAAVASLGATARRTYLASIVALARFDARACLAALRCPTLVVAGARDRTISLAAQERLATAIPGARLLVLADAGHAANCDQPAGFNEAVLAFVQGVERG